MEQQIFIPKVSIITVCLNCYKTIASTMESIFRQTYGNTECIVIDGNSKDGTLEYLESVEKKLSVLISEPDNGIYDAMNKGARLATGDYIIFMNAGDRFVNHHVLERVMTNTKVLQTRPKIISGRVQFEHKGELLNKFRPSTPGKEGMGLPHQGTFIDVGLQKENPFCEWIKYVGDYELWRRLQSKSLFDVFYIDETVSVFSLGGISTSSKYDAKRYLERAYIDYLYSNKFGITDFLKLFFKVSMRKISFLFLGNKNVFILLRFVK